MLNYYNICLSFFFFECTSVIWKSRNGLRLYSADIWISLPLSSSSLFTVSTNTSQQGLRNVNEVDYTWRYNFSLLSIHKVFAAAFEQCSQPISTLAAVCGRLSLCERRAPLTTGMGDTSDSEMHWTLSHDNLVFYRTKYFPFWIVGGPAWLSEHLKFRST